jgi:UDP-glucose 4-epimerase
LELFNELVQLDRPRLIFSSSASVYGPTNDFEVFEDSPLNPLSPYAHTKQIMEMILADLADSTPLRAIILSIF